MVLCGPGCFSHFALFIISKEGLCNVSFFSVPSEASSPQLLFFSRVYSLLVYNGGIY